MKTTVRLPPLVTVDGSSLVVEIEEYLASLPAQARITVPYVSPLGSTLQPWNAGYPAPRLTLLDRLTHRPARPVPVSAAGHLRLTSRYIDAFGWLQGAMWDSAGRVCLLGAQAAVLAHGYGTPATVTTARVQLMEILHATGRPVRSPDEYNDRPTTRQADIHQLLDRAAARAQHLGL
ncbi:DUF6197 family protein [Streptomyces rubellomurinus]|uniref:Uncharacterized protein n=1 Tax=Streptomyces rubellomurinus (strain ATCC 31215) TaxID=359131 RepID=A0A0F2T5M0_STRR3|nr:hypothetical protein [Streptomyces rubellomurinus]KJS58483.1 hypothetical protein VM95_33005 [Streptomyces rubellomurinus]